MVYLLYLDESGSHTSRNNLAYVLVGIALHEADAARLQAALEDVLRRHLPHPHDPRDFEIHAAELRQAKREPDSEWLRVDDGHLRFEILRELFDTLAAFGAVEHRRPWRLFAALADPRDPLRERRAYQLVLNRFDDFLAELPGESERGLAISDVSAHERELQAHAAEWRTTLTELGKLDHLVDVPFFADSVATRLIQAADLVAWSLWRRFGSEARETRWAARFWPHFHRARDGRLTGLAQIAADGTCSTPEVGDAETAM